MTFFPKKIFDVCPFIYLLLPIYLYSLCCKFPCLFDKTLAYLHQLASISIKWTKPYQKKLIKKSNDQFILIVEYKNYNDMCLVYLTSLFNRTFFSCVQIHNNKLFGDMNNNCWCMKIKATCLWKAVMRCYILGTYSYSYEWMNN